MQCPFGHEPQVETGDIIRQLKATFCGVSRSWKKLWLMLKHLVDLFLPMSKLDTIALYIPLFVAGLIESGELMENWLSTESFLRNGLKGVSSSREQPRLS